MSFQQKGQGALNRSPFRLNRSPLALNQSPFG